MAILKDSGARTVFSTGAVRDANNDKGRMDLVPLDLLAKIIAYYANHKTELDQHAQNADLAVCFVLDCWNDFQWKGDNDALIRAFIVLALCEYGSVPKAALELSIHFKDGAKKYSENNWRLALSLHRYVDSGSRHLLQWYNNEVDEPHPRAALWNLMCGLWTAINFDVSNEEIHDLPYDKKKRAETAPIDFGAMVETTGEDENGRVYTKDAIAIAFDSAMMVDRAETKAEKGSYDVRF